MGVHCVLCNTSPLRTKGGQHITSETLGRKLSLLLQDPLPPPPPLPKAVCGKSIGPGQFSRHSEHSVHLELGQAYPDLEMMCKIGPQVHTGPAHTTHHRPTEGPNHLQPPTTQVKVYISHTV